MYLLTRNKISYSLTLERVFVTTVDRRSEEKGKGAITSDN